jgi:hypothetical protein
VQRPFTPEYLAGFFDGEGTVTLQRRTYKTAKYGIRQTFSLKAIIPNTVFSIIEDLKTQFGGAVSYRLPKNSPRANYCAVWIVTGEKAAEFLRLIQPHLRLKQAQCALGLEFFASTHEEGRYVGVDGRGWKRTPEAMERDLAFKTRMLELNRRGIPN